MHKLFVYILFICISYTAKAQYPVSRILNTENGLPSNTVYNMLQDNDGYIWLAHDKGLSRYDGTNFKNYVTTTQKGKAVSNLISYKNNVFCQDFTGSMYLSNDNNNLLEEIKGIKSIGAYSVAGISKNNKLLIVNYDSIKSLDLETKKRTAFVNTAKLTLQAILSRPEGVYFIQDNVLKLFDGTDITTIEICNKELNGIFYLIKPDNAYYGVRREDYPYLYKITPNKVEPVFLMKEGIRINEVTELENEIWISTSSGAYCFNKLMQPKYNGLCFFPENSISKVLKDREGSYWFSTTRQGVMIVNNINSRIFKYGSEDIVALNSYKPSSILAASGSGLIFSFDKKTNAINTIITKQLQSDLVLLHYDSTLNNIITSSSKFAVYKNENLAYEIGLAGKSVAIIDDNVYAVAMSAGIVTRPRKNKLRTKSWIDPYITIRDQITYFIKEGARGLAVYFDAKDSVLYTSTADGVFYFTPKTKGEIKFENNTLYVRGFAKVGNIIYAATNNGVVKIENFKASKQGLTSEKISKTVYKIYGQLDKYIWTIGDQVVQRIDPASGAVYSYSTADGLPKSEYKDIVIDDNYVYVATTEGLVLLDANVSPLNEVKPILKVDKILVNDKEYKNTETLTLHHTENNVQIFVSLLAFKETQKASIRYRINNGDWKNLINGTRVIPLLSLSAGTYTIELNATNEDGISIEKNIILTIKIKAAFYTTAWFWALITLSLLGLLYAYFRLRLKNEQSAKALAEQKITLERELHQSMLSSIKSQMNPHFLFNALNTIQSYIYTNEKENASLYLGKFSELTRMILDMSNKEAVVLADEIKVLKLYLELEELRFENKLKYNMTIADSLDIDDTYLPAMLIQPYLENAIKHGLMHQRNAWKLDITFNKTDTGIEVMVDDNGIGRKASEVLNAKKNKNHTSFATSANQRRLDILNKGLAKGINLQIIDKEDEHGNALGTKIILHIPTKN